MTVNTKIATNTMNTNLSTSFDKSVIAAAIMSNTPNVCGSYYKDLPLQLLEIHPDIQRILAPEHYGAIARDWNTEKCAPLTVSLQEDGTFYIIDGQHRFMAARSIGVSTLPCRIFKNLTPDKEAEMFYKQNENNKRLTPRDTLRARLFINEPVAESLQAICREYGVALFRTSKFDKPWLRALCDVQEILKFYGEDVVRGIFDFIANAGWKDEQSAYSKDVIRACMRYLRHHKMHIPDLLDVGWYISGLDLQECMIFALGNCYGKTRESCFYNFLEECDRDIDNVKRKMRG